MVSDENELELKSSDDYEATYIYTKSITKKGTTVDFTDERLWKLIRDKLIIILDK